jgi:hypothetical protein
MYCPIAFSPLVKAILALNNYFTSKFTFFMRQTKFKDLAVKNLAHFSVVSKTKLGVSTNFARKRIVKDLVQPKKRGVNMGINRFISTLYTIANAF